MKMTGMLLALTAVAVLLTLTVGSDPRPRRGTKFPPVEKSIVTRVKEDALRKRHTCRDSATTLASADRRRLARARCDDIAYLAIDTARTRCGSLAEAVAETAELRTGLFDRCESDAGDLTWLRR